MKRNMIRAVIKNKLGNKHVDTVIRKGKFEIPFTEKKRKS